MPNQPDPEKKRIVYSEWQDVVEELEEIRKEMAQKEGLEEITEAEFFRRLTLDYVNKRRKAQRKKLILRDPASGPGGAGKSVSKSA